MTPLSLLSSCSSAEIRAAVREFLILVAVFAALLLTGCDSVVSQVRGLSRTEERTVSCTHAGYCLTCMPGFDGKMNCGLKFSAFCGGSQIAQVSITPILVTRESGATYTFDEVVVLKRLGDCR